MKGNDLKIGRRREKKDRPTVLLSLRNDISESTVNGIMIAARDCGWDLLNLAFSNGHIPPYVQAKGAIVQCLPDQPEVEGLRKHGCKIVRVGRLPHPDDHLLPTVIPDLAAAGRLAATHLNDRGFKDLGYVGYKGNAAAHKIWEGFRDQAKELGCSSTLLVLKNMLKSSASRQEQQVAEERRWILSQPKPFGLFSYSDQRAGRLCGTCRDAGLSVPEDVAIIGCGNQVQMCETASVSLSSIDINEKTSGLEAARLLGRLLTGEDAPSPVTMIPPKEVVQRHSTDVLAVPHPTVAKALRYIWENFRDPISVEDIAREAAASRCGLDRLFRRYLGRTVNAELGRKRLERCAELLRSTDLSVTDIAEFAGFQTRTYLHKMFLRTYGISPRQYRLQSKLGE